MIDLQGTQAKVLCGLTRREMLRIFMIALPAAAIGWKRIDYFDRELVCVHVYDPEQTLPTPLHEKAGTSDRKPTKRSLFHVGLPELVLCQTNTSFLQRYPFFWPVTRDEVEQLKGSMRVLQQIKSIRGDKDIDGLREKLLKHRRQNKETSGHLAVIFTLNDSSTTVCSAVVDACRSYRVDELVIFKDPSRPPYLCSYPTLQRGFKRPPPIG